MEGRRRAGCAVWVLPFALLCLWGGRFLREWCCLDINHFELSSVWLNIWDHSSTFYFLLCRSCLFAMIYKAPNHLLSHLHTHHDHIPPTSPGSPFHLSFQLMGATNLFRPTDLPNTGPIQQNPAVKTELFKQTTLEAVYPHAAASLPPNTPPNRALLHRQHFTPDQGGSPP